MKRREGERFEDYRERRAAEQKRDDDHLKGQLFWNSIQRGTYYRDPDWKGEGISVATLEQRTKLLNQVGV